MGVLDGDGELLGVAEGSGIEVAEGVSVVVGGDNVSIAVHCAVSVGKAVPGVGVPEQLVNRILVSKKVMIVEKDIRYAVCKVMFSK
jgi:hypothetical protein